MQVKDEYPNMQTEVIESIHAMLEDYPEVEVDTYRYLASLRDSPTKTNNLSGAALKELWDKKICPSCGNHLQTIETEEIIEKGYPTEKFYDWYCPYCDLKE